MTILHSADLHIGNFRGPEKNGLNLRGSDILRCLDFLVDVAVKEKPDLIVISGDVFNQARLWSDRALPEVGYSILFFKRLGAVAPVCVLKGTPNHDGSGQFQVLCEVFADAAYGVHILDRPSVTVIETKSGKINVAALPGFDYGIFRSHFPGLSKEDESAAITQELGKIVLGLRGQCDKSYPSVLLAHYTVLGANTESGQVPYSIFAEPVLTPEVLDAAGYDLVALGHIHRPQRVASVSGNVYYSGAVNSLNFNDEAQSRGFWIHDLESDEHRFIETPYRPFKTIRMTSQDVEAFNSGNVDAVSYRLWRNQIKDCIVRVLYQCTQEDEKALNKALLGKYLMLGGAFFVSEIVPEEIAAVVNKEAIREDSSPADALRTYCLEKNFSQAKIEEILQTASPIMSRVAANPVVSGNHGLFEPLSIEVTNYRRYFHEFFDFTDVSFCTINGKNGVGKSSLFMDAPIDCLFEKPREGILTGWINNADSVRSGSIVFTFKIGQQIYRVTRTRAKSGRATLNISELVHGEWKSRSKERFADTQKEIVRILGMDSQTMRSCAMIMQDQYGIFLEASKETRMEILGSLLGIGVYAELEDAAKQGMTAAERERRKSLDEIDVLAGSLQDVDQIKADISRLGAAVEQKQKNISQKAAAADRLKFHLNSKREAAERVKRLQERIISLLDKKSGLSVDRKNRETTVSDADLVLGKESEIQAGVKNYYLLLEQEKALISEKASFDARRNELNTVSTGVSETNGAVQKYRTEKSALLLQAEPLEASIASEAELKAKFDQYTASKKVLDALEVAAGQYILLSNSISALEKEKAERNARFREEAAMRATRLKGFQDRAKLLENTGCIDIGQAHCRFLKDAWEAKAATGPYYNECHEWRLVQESEMSALQVKINGLLLQREKLHYDAAKVKIQRQLVFNLEKSAREYEQIPGLKGQMQMIYDRFTVIDAEIAALQRTLSEQLQRQTEIRNAVQGLKEIDGRYTALQTEIQRGRQWLVLEKELPVEQERKQNALRRIEKIQKGVREIDDEMNDLQRELSSKQQDSEGKESLESELSGYEADIVEAQKEIQSLSQKIGALKSTLERQSAIQQDISERRDHVRKVADQIVILEEVKEAFSKDGIPHSIVKSILPFLTATANNILSQMTGGDMSVEFVTEKTLKSNAAREVVTLDILIREAGQQPMPYLSKSGGEKVKSSLSVVLALSEVMSRRAGIQLGMLMIDEPPFLDEDGVTAYCDALEAISRRYAGMKIMAVTHDQTMRARFPQSVEIVRDEEGSHVMAA